MQTETERMLMFSDQEVLRNHSMSVMCTYRRSYGSPDLQTFLCVHICHIQIVIIAVNSDVLSLVDFYRENGLVETNASDNSKTYPLTAQGMQPAALLEKLYQQFVVAAFSAEGPKAERYI